MTQTPTKQSGFTAVELLITLFVAAAFLIAGFQLFNVVIRDGGQTRSESRAANVAYDYMRQYKNTATTIPCTASTPLNNASITVDGLTNVTISITISCLPDAINSLSKIEASISYNSPVQTVKYATYSSSTGATTGTADITTGLVAWFKLNGDANTSVGSQNGVITNATSTTNQGGYADSAYAFNGLNASIIANSSYGLGTTNLSMSCWVNSSSASNSGEFLKIGTSGYGIGIGGTTFDNSTPGTKIVMRYEGIRWIPTTTDLLAGGWHHIVMVIDASGVPTAYLDGVSTGANAGAGPLAPGSEATYIGGGDTATRWFNGSVDDVRLYNRALPSADILALLSGGPK